MVNWGKYLALKKRADAVGTIFMPIMMGLLVITLLGVLLSDSEDLVGKSFNSVAVTFDPITISNQTNITNPTNVTNLTIENPSGEIVFIDSVDIIEPLQLKQKVNNYVKKLQKKYI